MKDISKRFISEHPIIFWFSLGLISIAIPFLSICFCIAGICFYFSKLTKLKLERAEGLVLEAKGFVAKIQNIKSMTPIKTSLLLQPNEYAFLQENALLIEPRSVRRSRGGSIHYRLTKGVSVSEYTGQVQSHKEWKAIGTGQLVLTSKKLVFIGNSENRNIKLEKILSVSKYLDRFEIVAEHLRNTCSFQVQNPLIWSSALSILRSTQNPMNLESRQLDVDFHVDHN